MSPRRWLSCGRDRRDLLAGLVGLVLLAAAGCAVGSSPSAPAGGQNGPTESLTERELSELFVDRARQLIDRDRPDRAESYLDRAVNLRPENPRIWFQLARLRRRQGRLRQVEVLAQKSLGLNEGNRPLKIRTWRLIAEVRDRRGDHEGARRARDRADRLEGGW